MRKMKRTLLFFFKLKKLFRLLIPYLQGIRQDFMVPIDGPLGQYGKNRKDTVNVPASDENASLRHSQLDLCSQVAAMEVVASAMDTPPIEWTELIHKVLFSSFCAPVAF